MFVKMKMIILILFACLLTLPLASAKLHLNNDYKIIQTGDEKDYNVLIGDTIKLEEKDNGWFIELLEFLGLKEEEFYEKEMKVIMICNVPIEKTSLASYETADLSKESNTLSKDNNGCFVDIFDPTSLDYKKYGEHSIEIIKIKSAEHLDKNKILIEDIYSFVYEQDDIWTTISDNEYIRATFEENLTNRNDIKIYVRGSDSIVEVYEKDGIDKIAEFNNINDTGYYDIYLNNLNNSQDTFDLKVIGNPVEFDYIVDPPTIIYNCTDLQSMNISLSGSYILNNTINCSATNTWNGGSGFIPVGSSLNKFTGILNGQGFNITNLFINRSINNIGLFGYISGANIINVSLINESINSDKANTGGIAGSCDSSNISYVSSTGSVIGASNVGGLAGIFDANSIITTSYSESNVYGTGGSIGGLVGDMSGKLNNTYATGNVIGKHASSTLNVGGLIGVDSGGIANSYATGNVSVGTGSGTSGGGGLVGRENTYIINSFATGNITGTGTSNVGGLAGRFLGTIINNSYWYDWAGDSATGCYAAGDVGCTKINNTNGGIAYFTGDVYPTKSPMSSWGFYLYSPFGPWYEWINQDDYPRFYRRDTCNYLGVGNWDVLCSDNCTINLNVNIDENNITINGTGQFIMNGTNITTTGTKLIAGTSLNNRCNVYCIHGGCFK